MINATPFAALAVPTVDAAGRQVVIAVVKASFDLTPEGRLSLRDQPTPVRASDELHDAGEPRSSLRYPGDICVEKRGTDVVVVGEAVSPRPVTSMDVAVKVREAVAPLRVHGPRVYYRSLARVAVGPAATFERQPIRYEHAYGGMTADLALVESRNPAGVGVARSASDLIDTPAPQIEHPADPIDEAGEPHAPVGFGAILPHWSPRREYAGTFDAAWQDTRMPLLPLDFDLRHNSVAHPTLVFDPPLAPGDPIALMGMSERGVESFSVPDLRLVLRARYDTGEALSIRPPIDTLLVEPGEARLEITLRKAFPVGRGKRVLREIRVDIDG